MEEDQWSMLKSESHYFPSIQKGMRPEKEMSNRMQGVCLLQCIGARLDLPIYVIATAATLFHRFYARQSFYDYKLTKIAPACLYIACKSDESSRRPHDLAKSWLYEPDRTVSERRINLFVADLLYYELLVLEITGFDLQIDHPYYELGDFVRELEVPNEIANAALGFVNDSLRLPLCIWYHPKGIAAAALVIAYTAYKQPFPTDTDTEWGQYIEEDSDLLEEIVDSIMEVYKLSKKTGSTNSTNSKK